MKHRIWQCEKNSCEYDEFAKSEHLVARALIGADCEPAVWLRGLTPRYLTTPVFHEERLAQEVLLFGPGGFDDYRRDGVLTLFGTGRVGDSRTISVDVGVELPPPLWYGAKVLGEWVR